MPIRLSGLSSGLDTESIIKDLMSAQSLKVTKIQNKKTKLGWKEEKWQDLNKKIYNLYTGELSKLKLQSSYLTKQVTTSDSSKATITASSSVPTGTHSLEISSVASSQFVTGEKIDTLTVDGVTVKGSDITSNTKLTALGVSVGTIFTIDTKEGGAKEFSVDASTKISDFTKFAKEQGVNLTYDTTNQRFFASSVESGSDHAFSLTSKTATPDAATYLGNLKKAVGFDHLTTAQKETITDALNTISTEADTSSNDYVAAMKTLNLYADAYKKTADTPDVDESSDKFASELQKNIEDNLKIQDFDIKLDVITENTTKLKDSFNDTGKSALTIMGLGEIQKDGVVSGTSKANFVKAENCVVVYNKTTFESGSNTMTVNGLTINAVEVTDSPMKINITNNTDNVYDMIKGFTKTYNSILKEANDLYYAGTAKGYDVLSDEERDAMTDEQIEKWETKIKDSLLRNDTTLGSLRSALTTITSTNVTVNGKSYSLSSFGIGTADYTEKGLLHIDGNSEDSKSSDKPDKLMAAISADPDLVMDVFTEIGNQLYKTLTDKMASSKLSSALTFYNDKQITSQKSSYEKEIAKWEEKLSDMEDRYYSKFSAMETALAKLNSQTSYFSSMFSS